MAQFGSIWINSADCRICKPSSLQFVQRLCVHPLVHLLGLSAPVIASLSPLWQRSSRAQSVAASRGEPLQPPVDNFWAVDICELMWVNVKYCTISDMSVGWSEWPDGWSAPAISIIMKPPEQSTWWRSRIGVNIINIQSIYHQYNIFRYNLFFLWLRLTRLTRLTHLT